MEVNDDKILLVVWMRKGQRSGPHDAWIPAYAGMTDRGERLAYARE